MFILQIQLYKKNIQILYYKKYHSILDALEKNNIKLEYQCREGYCGTCKTNLIYGSIIYLKKPLACIKNTEILICCSLPVTNIQLKI